jgi:hypothetical protein
MTWAHDLGSVVQTGELGGFHLQVDLEAGVAGFEHDGIVLDVELVRTLDPELVRLTAPHL